MVVTMLEGRIDSAKWGEFARSYTSVASDLPPQIVQTYLLQSADDAALWRVVTVWRSQDDLDGYRRSVETPAAVLMFRSVGVEPTLTIFDVAALASHQ